jgi:hypothetical protein
MVLAALATRLPGGSQKISGSFGERFYGVDQRWSGQTDRDRVGDPERLAPRSTLAAVEVRLGFTPPRV